MQLQTFVNRGEFKKDFKYENKALFLGSCFSVNMAKKFKESKLQNLVNPLGILYSPESIIKLLAYSLGLEAFSENRISEWQGYFYYDDAHSEIYASSKEELRIKIEDKIEQLSSYLKEVDKIFLTFGTSFSYKKKSSGEFVANCHKQKASSFEKRCYLAKDFLSCLRRSLRPYQLKKLSYQ